MPAAPSASLRKASLRALSAAAFWRPLPWPSSRRRPSRRRPFQPRPFRRPPSRQQPFRRRPSWRRLPWPSSRRRPFRPRPFPQRPFRRQPCQRPGVPAPGASFLQLGLLALFLQARLFLGGLGGFARLFLFLTLLLGLLQRDLRVDFRLGWLDLARAEAGRIRLLLRLGFRLRLGLRLGFGRFGRGRRRNGRIAVRPELHFHRAGRFRAPVQVEDQHGQQQRVHQQGQKQGFPVVSVGRRGRGRCGVE